MFSSTRIESMPQVDHGHVDGPEGEEAGELGDVDAEARRRGSACQRGNEDREDLVDGLAADPGLDAEPAAGDEGAQEGGEVGAARAERGAAEDRKGDAVLACPACAFRIIGTSTIRLPRKIVRIACHQFMPPPISEEASM